MAEDLNIKRVLRGLNARADAVRSFGISVEDVVDGKQAVPPGWRLDHLSDYYLPENVVPFPPL